MRDVIQMQIAEFFGVKWQAVVVLLFVIAGLIAFAYLRTVSTFSEFWGWKQLLLVGVLLLLVWGRRFWE